MIDSVLKGTGNSRFLKSAVPAGTSWADALAMLHSGTFPIDFNGINTEGFQQVGTPLNKANLLKDATAAQIGLPPSTTPDGMFQALGNTGELHVWRKTAGTTTTYPVSTNPNAYQEGSDAKPAGYKLGDVVTGIFRVNAVYNATTVYYANSVNVDNNGVVTLSDQSDYTLFAEEDSYNNAKNLAGKFIIADYDHKYCKIPKGVVLFIPANTTISFRQDVPGDNGYGIFFDRYQPVTGYAAIPAGTTIEYLGKLGDKARMQVVSYVGTGTYGNNNPCSISVNFPMKAIVFLARFYTDNGNKKISKYFVSPNYGNDVSSILVEEVPKTYSQFLGLGNNYYSNNFGKRSRDRKSYYWYNTNNASDQGNSADIIYYFLVIG